MPELPHSSGLRVNLIGKRFYEITDPKIASQILQPQASGADLLYDASIPKFSAMAIRKVADLDWHPLHVVDSNGALVKPALASAGLDKSVV